MRHPNKIAARNYATSWAKVILFVGLTSALLVFVGVERIQQEGSLFLTMPAYLLAGVLLLMPANIGFEWIKYKLALKGTAITSATLQKAFARGLTWRFILPNKMGLAASVVLSSPKDTKLDAAWRLTLANSMQLLVTLAIGFVSFISLQDRVVHTLQIPNHWLWIAGLTVLLFLGYVFRKPVAKQWQSVRKTPRVLLWQLFGLSGLRYGIFLLQFAMAVSVLNPSISWELSVQTVPLVFLYASLVPLGFLGSIGARESIAVGVFMLVAQQAEGVVAASVLVWAVNLLLPAIFGFAVQLVTLIRNRVQC